jgi:DNA polymerase-3 subunit alpha
MFKFDENDGSFWHLYKDGLTKGIFQLESNLGRTWCKKLCPESIEELAALIALIRPGPLKGKIDGKSMTQRYVDRKHKLEPITYIHDSLEDILKTTYGVLVYQEQAMLIAVKLAGFNEQEADNLRKAIGKKKADLMMEIREQFIAGCEKVGLVDKKTATEIFSWIEKSARYQFNKCLSPSTVVETPSGEKTLSELKVGDRVLYPLNHSVDDFTEVLDIIDTGEQEVWEVELEDGKTISCTMSHKFLCKDGVKRPLIEILEKDLEIMCID